MHKLKESNLTMSIEVNAKLISSAVKCTKSCHFSLNGNQVSGTFLNSRLRMISSAVECTKSCHFKSEISKFLQGLFECCKMHKNCHFRWESINAV